MARKFYLSLLRIINNQIELIFIKPQANHPFPLTLLNKNTEKVIVIKSGCATSKEEEGMKNEEWNEKENYYRKGREKISLKIWF